MTDYFVLLGEVRRPWIDNNKLKQKYHRLTLQLHPDLGSGNRTSSKDTGSLTELNEAFRVLQDPKLRLQHLLMLENAAPVAARSVPPALANLFWDTGTSLKNLDAILEKQSSTSRLTQALGKSEIAAAEMRMREILDQLRSLYNDALEKVRRTDPLWLADPAAHVSTLVDLYDSFSYLSRLIEQVNERRLRLRVG
jgi:curved DNA-binding protein CbpA